MEKTKYPNADRRCVNCKYYEVITNIAVPGQQASICRIEPPKLFAQMVLGQQQDPKTGATIQVPQWVPWTAYPFVGANDWCGRFTKALTSVPDGPATISELK